MGFAAVDALLRGAPTTIPLLRAATAGGAVGAALVGVVLGAGGGDFRLALFAAIKVPLLLACCAALCLPFFYVLNAVLGLRDDFLAALGGLAAAQATLGIALGAMAPLLVVATLSVADPYALTLCDALAFATATLAAQQVLARHYRPLIARDVRHRAALRSWLVLYAFAGVQLAWVLRPFRGTQGFAVQFLRPEAFEQNAYLVVLDHVRRLFD